VNRINAIKRKPHQKHTTHFRQTPAGGGGGGGGKKGNPPNPPHTLEKNPGGGGGGKWKIKGVKYGELKNLFVVL